MKNIKLNAAKSLFIVALLCQAIFADGDQGSGGFASTDAPEVKSIGASMEGDQGSGGLSRTGFENAGYLDAVLNTIYGYVDSII